MNVPFIHLKFICRRTSVCFIRLWLITMSSVHYALSRVCLYRKILDKKKCLSSKRKTKKLKEKRACLREKPLIDHEFFHQPSKNRSVNSYQTCHPTSCNFLVRATKAARYFCKIMYHTELIVNAAIAKISGSVHRSRKKNVRLRFSSWTHGMCSIWRVHLPDPQQASYRDILTDLYSLPTRVFISLAYSAFHVMRKPWSCKYFQYIRRRPL